LRVEISHLGGRVPGKRVVDSGGQGPPNAQLDVGSDGMERPSLTNRERSRGGAPNWGQCRGGGRGESASPRPRTGPRYTSDLNGKLESVDDSWVALDGWPVEVGKSLGAGCLSQGLDPAFLSKTPFSTGLSSARGSAAKPKMGPLPRFAWPPQRCQGPTRIPTGSQIIPHGSTRGLR
jgi:hypothetical protein